MERAPLADELVEVREVADAEPSAGALFRRCFGDDPPDFPRHFVAVYRGVQRAADSGAASGVEPGTTLGYIHFTPWEQCYLGGGMCFDDRAYRRLPAAERNAIRAAGGIAEILLRRTQVLLDDAVALFGHVGEPRAERVDLRSGYVHTGHPHLIVCWRRRLAAPDERALLERAASLGPF